MNGLRLGGPAFSVDVHAVGLGANDDYFRPQTNKNLGRKTVARVCTVSCLDFCDYGPNMIVYPEGTLYSHLTRETARAAYDGEMGDGPKRADLELELPEKD